MVCIVICGVGSNIGSRGKGAGTSPVNTSIKGSVCCYVSVYGRVNLCLSVVPAIVGISSMTDGNIVKGTTIGESQKTNAINL